MPPVELLLARQLRVVLKMVKKRARSASLIIHRLGGILRRHGLFRLRASLERDHMHLLSFLRLTLLHGSLGHTRRYYSLWCLTLGVPRRSEGHGLWLGLDHAWRLNLLLDLF